MLKLQEESLNHSGGIMLLTTERERPILAWWLRVDTTHPICSYYFGPFDNQHEAELEKQFYFDDLKQENAQIIDAEIKFCQPRKLTILENELSIRDLKSAS